MMIQNELQPRLSGVRHPQADSGYSRQGRAYPSTSQTSDPKQLIASVVMTPQMMWTKQFYHTISGMKEEDQKFIEDWFSDMNKKQRIYIKEIERANNQLKETAARLFTQMKLSKGQIEQFLKKVNFMENREYFFNKKKVLNIDADEVNERVAK